MKLISHKDQNSAEVTMVHVDGWEEYGEVIANIPVGSEVYVKTFEEDGSLSKGFGWIETEAYKSRRAFAAIDARKYGWD